MPLKGRAKTYSVNPGASAAGSGDSVKQTVAAAAAKYHVAPQTVWGVFGQESDYGRNPSQSSAGAQGPMQFEPPTGATYGLNSTTIHDTTASIFAGAHYLHDLGANTDPNSTATKNAIVGYNTGRAGDYNTDPGYLNGVLTKGRTWDGPDAGNVADPRGSAQNVSALSNAPSILDVLNALVTGNIDAFAADLAITGLEIAKNIGQGFVDLIVAPLWHWEQRQVAYYTTYVLDPRKYGTTGDYKWAFPWTAAFWGLGYAILWTEPGNGLKPVPVGRSRLARHVRTTQKLPARGSLVKPRNVQEHTPKKPSEVESRTSVSQVGTLTTYRNRPVRVKGDLEDAHTAETPIEQVGTEASRPDAKSHPEHHSGEGTRQDRGTAPEAPTARSGGKRVTA